MNKAVDAQFMVWRNRAEAAQKALTDILDANDEFRSGMPDDWEGDPLQDACAAARDMLRQWEPKQLVTKHRPDPDLDRTLSAVNDAMNQGES